MHPSEQQEAFVLKYIVDQWIPTHLHFRLLLGERAPGDCDKPLRNERFDTKNENQPILKRKTILSNSTCGFQLFLFWGAVGIRCLCFVNLVQGHDNHRFDSVCLRLKFCKMRPLEKGIAFLVSG